MSMRTRLLPTLLALTFASSVAAQPNEDKRPQPKGAFVPDGVKVVRDLEYAKVGDKKLLLDLYLPEKAEGPLPVIVGIHGGGWANGSKAGGQGNWLARHGYAVAVINYRLSGEAIFPAQIEDCKAAVRWLRANAKKYNLDPDRFGATGHSAGGHLTSLLATTGDIKEFDKGDHLDFSSRIQAAVPSAGPTDFLQMDANAPKGARLKHDDPKSPEARLIGGPIQENKEKVAKTNPITYVSKDDPPFLIVHGDSDEVVPAHQAQLLHEALNKAGVESKLHLVKGAGHAVGGRDVNEQVVAFFNKNLKVSGAGGKPTMETGESKRIDRLSLRGGKRPLPPGLTWNRFREREDAHQPVGLFVCRGPGPTSEKEVNFPFIDGWLVRPGWDKVEPQEGKFDWAYIDNEVEFARKLKKKITLSILGGPQTPDWVYKAGAQQFAYTMPIGRKREAKIPLLWDETYLKKWTNLIAALGKRYDGEETVILIHITGATGNGLEMQLPFTPPDRKNWEKLGYTPEKAIQGWQRIIDTYAEAFPSKPLDIDIHPVLGSDQVATGVTAYGSKKLGQRFGVFGGWLSGKDASQDQHHAGMHALAKEYGPKGFSAWQMIASQTANASNPRFDNLFAPGGLKSAIEQGMSWNARYFEVWETDAMNEKLHPLLTEMAARLKK